MIYNPNYMWINLTYTTELTGVMSHQDPPVIYSGKGPYFRDHPTNCNRLQDGAPSR